MVRLKINNAKTFVPSSISRGSTPQRMQKARVFNLAFYDNLQYSMKNNEIAPKTFIDILKTGVGKTIGIKFIPTENKNSSYTAFCFNEKATNIGYVIGLPLNYNKKIHHNLAKTFLEKTQELLNYSLNPKILKRFTTLINKGYRIKDIENFYQENISKQSILTKDVLNQYLTTKTNTEKIDLLQFFRYKLLAEQNTAQASFQIDKRIEKYNHCKFIYPSNHYDLSRYHYYEKLNILNEKLLETIMAERN